MAEEKHNLGPMWKKLMNDVDLDEPTSFLDHVYLGCTQRGVSRTKSSLMNTGKCSNHEFLLEQVKNTRVGKSFTQRRLRGLVIRKDMLKNALRDIAKWLTKRQSSYTKSQVSPCLDDHHFKKDELESVGELSQVCSQIVLKCLYLARNGRPYILWSVKKLARSITKWNNVDLYGPTPVMLLHTSQPATVDLTLTCFSHTDVLGPSRISRKQLAAHIYTFCVVSHSCIERSRLSWNCGIDLFVVLGC